MRIIGGTNKRRMLRVPSGLPVRPTTDMAKEALFNILNNHFDFEGLRVLDLFAGTGNISFEFASRGAADVTSVELDNRCADYIRVTASKLHFEHITVIKGNAFRYMENCRFEYDIIFADPPFDLTGIRMIPDLVLKKRLLAPDGWLILEHPSSVKLDDHAAFFEHRRYGQVNFSFFRDVRENQ